MRKETVKILFIALFFSVVFSGVAKTKTVNAQAYQVASVKCNCTTAFSACGNYFGQTNVKRRTCTAIMTGSQTCTVATAGPTFWQVVTCTAVGTPTPTLTGGMTGTPTPTPTTNPNCRCITSLNNCSPTACNFNKFSDLTYTYPIKCNLASSLFASLPTATNKNDWCKAKNKTRGDADLNGIINLKDYFYYVAAKSGAKIPPTVNPDFNGDNAIDNKDGVIIIKSLTTDLPD